MTGLSLTFSVAIAPVSKMSRQEVLGGAFTFCAAAVALIIAVRLLVRWVFAIRHRRRDGGLCPACGYDLRATSDRCPECGLQRS